MVTGGQAAAHAPVQVDVPFLSASHRYRVLPVLVHQGHARDPGDGLQVDGLGGAPLADAEAAAAGLLAWAGADDDGGGLAAVLDPELLEQALAASAMPAAQAAAAIQFLIMMLPV